MKKIILSVLFVLVTVSTSYADVTIKQIRSAEYMKNEGYSNATINMVQKESGEFSVQPTNIWQKIGFKIWDYLDPVAPEMRDEPKHDIKQYSYFGDL